MNPVFALALGPFYIAASSYRLFLLLAVTVTLGLALGLAIWRGLPCRRSLICLVAMAAAVPVGARLLDAATKIDHYAREPERLFATDLVGFSLFGGLLLAGGVGVLACRWLSLDLLRLADSTAPALGVGIALMRWGCYEAGCCFGLETDLPWGVTFPVGSDAHLYQLLHRGALFALAGPRPVHPTQLYEMLAVLVGAIMAFWLLRRRLPAGAVFLAAATWYAAFRLLNHYVRAPSDALGVPDWFYPALYAAIVLVTISALLWRNAHGPAPRARPS